ncbi:S41 family peptidase [Gemmatimonas aurantiaca]|uniref:S41 family peptidase n=1 Tax=Gemmatimonas aurantiaca TaxID=173480 RepID=UPI00301CBD17
MTRNRKAALAALVFVPLLASGFALQARTTRGGAQLLDQVLTFVALRYVDTLDAQQLYEKAARGLVKELNDPYTELFTPKQLEEFSRNTNGRYAGIGMEISKIGDYVTVNKVFPNSPAEQGGVLEGDKIALIDTTNTRGYSTQQVQNKLLGPIGTPVTVQFLRVGVGQPVKLSFKRAEIHVPAVPYAMMLDERTGYVPLTRFSEQTTEDIANSVLALRKKGAKGIIIDLRGNPGGILEEAFAMSNLFLPKGKELLSVRGRAEFQKFVSQQDPLAPDVPLLVLVDGNSASASEIVAGALQDYDRALVLGTTSFGKGLVQSVYNLDGGYALKITTGKWYTPSGRSIQKERKMNADGQFLEVTPDSLETDSVRKARPLYKSASGRTLYGGGGITPDMIIAPDTLTSPEQVLRRALLPSWGKYLAQVNAVAEEQKGKVRPDFTFNPTWRDEVYRRIVADTVKIDKAIWDAGASDVDRVIEDRVAKVAFGDTLVLRRSLKIDNQLRRAVELMRKGTTQQEIFAAAAQEPAAKPATARRSGN